MKGIKILNLRKTISFLLVFLLFFSQNSMIVFADILNTKSAVKVSNTLDNNINDGDYKSNKSNEKNNSEITTNDASTKESENDSRGDFIEPEKLEAGSYNITENGIYPFTGDWGIKHTLDSQKSNSEKISTYDNTKKGYFYNQLDVRKQSAYDLYVYVLKVLDKNEYLDVSDYNLYTEDFYGILHVATHENPDLFWGYDMIIEKDNRGIVTKLKYDTPFTQEELNYMKNKLDDAVKEIVYKIYSNLGENPTKFEIVKEIHDYLVVNNHYGTAPCPEQTHPKPGHLGCKGMIIEHCAYGALVKSNKYGVVCEGFATAFILLCKQFDIDSLYDSGFNTSGNNLHAWNYVKMDDGKWYVVDLTHDNASIKKEGIVYTIFLTGMKNTNFEFRHDKYLGCYLNECHKAQEYKIPEISQDSYIKFEVIYPKNSKITRNIFFTFKDMLNDIQRRNLKGDYQIILRDDYTLTPKEVNQLKDYNGGNEKKFILKSDSQKSKQYYTLNSQTKEIYFPMSIDLQNIKYEIESTYIGNRITIAKNVSNGSSKCSIYLLGKGNDARPNEVFISSGSWENVVGAYSNLQNVGESTNKGDVYFNIKDSTIKNIILAQGSIIKGDIDVQISNDGVVENLIYGNDIELEEGKNLNISISDATVRNFKQNNSPIFANANIYISDAIVKNLIGPYVSDINRKYTTTININDDIDIKSILDFDKLVIGSETALNVTDELDYNKNKHNRKGLVEFNGSSTLKLPKSIAKVGSLISKGESNELIISKENAYLTINERQVSQGTPITISYARGLIAKNGDELIRYSERDDINLNNFRNGINEKFQLYDDEATFSIRLYLSTYPITVKCSESESYKCNSLYSALEYIERKVDENISEVKFYINDNYEMTEEDLMKLEAYSTRVNNQKFVFTSENKFAVLSTSDDVIFPTNNKLEKIEFTDITLDFENKDIFAAGNHLIMSETVKMTPRSKINIYGGLPGRRVINSRLTLNGGSFNNVYGGGSLSNGIVSNNVDISLNNSVVVKGSVYGGAGYDKTGTNQTPGTTTINLLGGTVFGSIIGGGENSKSSVFNNIVINYGDNSSARPTKVNNICGLTKNLTPGTATNNITINIKKNANLSVIAGFNNLNISSGVTLNVSDVIKYDAGISSSLDGRVTLNSGSDLCIPNATNDEYRKIGQLETTGLSNLHIYKNKYLLIDDNIHPVIGKYIKISYPNEIPDLHDKLIKFSNNLLASNESFITDYNFDISADTKTGFLYLSQKTYKINLYKERGILDRTDVVYENGEYTFTEPTKTKGKRFVKWRDLDENRYYMAGEKINVNRDMSLEAEYEDVQEYTVTLKVNDIPYKTEYVEAGKPYTFEPAPQIPEKYFIGWEEENGLSNNLYSLSCSMIKGVSYIQPGTTIIVNQDLIYDAEYGNEVKYEVDYGDENGKIQNVYYDGGTINVSSTPPPGIKIPFGKIFGGFKVIFGGIGNIIGSIGNMVSVLFRPGDSITIQPGVKLEAVWVNECTIKIYDEGGKLTGTKKTGEGFAYTIPQAPKIEYKELLYWEDTLHPNNKYSENQNIVVSSDMDLKPVYKNLKVVSLYLDSNSPTYLPDFSSALNYAKGKNFRNITLELLENYSLTDQDILTLMSFNENNVNLTIRGCNEDIILKIDDSINLSVNTKFESIVFDYDKTNTHGIYARGNRLEMGENISMKGLRAPILLGGENKKDVKKSEIIVKSGTYSAIYGGGFSEYSGVHGDITIELDGGDILGDIYAGSQDTGLISCGSTNINLIGGTVGGVVSGSSRLLGLENSNHVNIKLAGTKIKEIYGGYVEFIEDDHDTGQTTIIVEKSCPLNKLVGFTKLDIKPNRTLTVNEVLNHKGGIRVTDESGEICLNGKSKLIVPSSENDLDRQAGWLNSTGENNEIRVDKNKYLTLTSKSDDVINNNLIILDFKNNDTSKDESILLKYKNKKEKANATKFKKGINIQTELVLKEDEENGTVYADERDLVSVINPNGKTRKFKTIQSAIKKVQSDSQEGKYTIRLLENYTLTESDINELKDFNENGVSFVVDGLTEGDKPNAMLNISNDIMLSTDTTFKNILFNYDRSNIYGIYARGHRLEMGENIEMKGLKTPILFGGENKKDVKKSEIIVKSGTYSAIYGGGSSEYSGVKGNITIELYKATVTGDIYAGSQDTGLISTGTTNIKLEGGSVKGIVSGTSKLLGLENSNNVNIYLKGTEVNKVYGGYVKDTEDSDDTGITTIFVEKACTLNTLVGFTNLEIAKDITLKVNDVLNHKGGIRVTDDSGKVYLNGNSKLVVPSTDDVLKRQVGWLKSEGQGNEIVVGKDNEYLSLTSEKDDEIDDNKVILSLKETQTNKESSILLKYENSKEKANTTKFEKKKNIPSELVLKCNKLVGSVYVDGKDLIKITKPHQESIEFKSIKDAIESIELDSQEGTYKITLLENYTLTEADIDGLGRFCRPNVDFIINGSNENTDLREVLKINNSIMLSTDTEFNNIILDYETTNGNEIYARGHKLEMGENITVEGICYPTLFGGENGKNVNHSEIIIKSGTYSAIYGGGSSENSGVHGNITIELDDGDVLGDIYAGSENMGLTYCGKTEIILAGGSVGGVVSGASKLLGLENSNNVNIQLLGTELNEVYGGYVEYGKDFDNTGITTVTVGKTCTLKELVGFTRLNIQPEVILTVTDVLNYKGGVSLVGDSAQINLNGNAELIDPPKYNSSNRKI